MASINRVMKRLLGVENVVIEGWDLGEKELTLGAASGVQVLDRDPANFDMAPTYVAAMREFVDAVRSGRRASPDLADGLASVRLALRAKA